MRLLQMIWRRYTLLCVLVITALPLMIIGWAGRNSLYSQYELAPLKEPGLALVRRGIHDGVYPWQNFLKKEAGRDKTLIITAASIATDCLICTPCAIILLTVENKILPIAALTIKNASA